MRPRVYSNYEIIESLFLLEDEDEEIKKLNTFIKKQPDILIDKSNDELIKLAEENPFLNALMKNPSRKVDGLKSFEGYFDEDNIANFCKDIILVSDPALAKELRENSGILALSEEELSDFSRYTKIIFSKRFQEGEENNGKNNWSEILKSINGLQYNCICIIDNYLAKETGGIKNLKSNLVTILENLKRDLKTPLQITLILKKPDEKLDVKEMHRQLKEVLNESDQLELIFHTRDRKDIHDRYIITPHFRIKVGVGFNLFDEKGHCCSTTTIDIEGHYNDLDENAGDIRFKQSMDELEHVMKVVNEFKNSRLEKGTEREFIYPEFIKNRIFDF